MRGQTISVADPWNGQCRFGLAIWRAEQWRGRSNGREMPLVSDET